MTTAADEPARRFRFMGRGSGDPDDDHRPMTAPPTTAVDPTIKRLAVNINLTTQARLRRVMERDGISLTDAVDYLIGVGNVFDTAHFDNDCDVLLRRPNGDTERLNLLRRKGQAQ